MKSTGRKKRFARLQLLLSRSQMYSTYLLGRLNARREAESKRLQRLEKKHAEQAENNSVTSNENKESDVSNTYREHFSNFIINSHYVIFIESNCSE